MPLLWAALFALAHTQSPLYYSNQNQYFLHGLALAGVGHLDHDWLANTRDPTPAFSALVAGAYRVVGPWAFQAGYFVLLGVYFEAARRLAAALPGFPDRGPGQALFLALFLAAHAAVLRVASIRLTGVDYPWFLQAGLAAQYLLGPGLQPSAFGVLLVVSLAAFLKERPILAAGLAAAAVVMHSTYMLSAGLLVLGYLLVLVREGRTRTARVAGALAFLMVLPVGVYNSVVFGPKDPDEFRAAQAILAEVRIPHHAAIGRWLDAVAVAQLGVMLAGLFLVRNTRLFLVLAVPTLGAAVLTGVQAATDSPTLALLFPWRFSVILMPLATAVLLAKFAGWVGQVAARRGVGRPVEWAGLGIALALAAGGVAVMALGLGYPANEAEEPLYEHVRTHAQPGDVYLLPVKFPTLKKEVPASQSKTFAPPVRSGAVGIPVDMQRFRLHTGAAIYVDFKAIPYAEADVLEWYRRLERCQAWYGHRDWDRPAIWKEVAAAGITHVVTTADKDVTSEMLERVYADDNYRVYRVRAE